MKTKVKKQTKSQLAEAKRKLVESHNNDIDGYINMVHKYYKAHIANPYKESDGYNYAFSGFTMNASGAFFTAKSKDFIDLINLLNSLKK